MAVTLAHTHSWNVTPAQAREIQESLRYLVIREDRLGQIRHVAGVDVGYEDHNRITRAAVAVLEFPELELVEFQLARLPTVFPYVPGLLSFREIPALLCALEGLRITPDVVLCDGQGLAHPRRFGLACHLGVVTDLPCIGVAKKRLLGDFREPAQGRGAWSPLHHDGEEVGAVLRTRPHVKPLFVSIGHRLGLHTAVDLVARCTGRYRLPETTRHAHRLASGPPPPDGNHL